MTFSFEELVNKFFKRYFDITMNAQKHQSIESFLSGRVSVVCFELVVVSGITL